jgi:type III restriction enzyme
VRSAPPTNISAGPSGFARDNDGPTIGIAHRAHYSVAVRKSEVEREFARKLDQREDIRLFVKLPDWFKVETPIGTYNPDWAIVKHHDETVYLVRETKGTKDFLKLRTTEAMAARRRSRRLRPADSGGRERRLRLPAASDKVRCGQRHFEALGVPFAVTTTANDV